LTVATILIVDDRPENRQFLTTLLGYGGHRLFEAVDGEEALAAARAHRPDLIITDLLMPTMDGFELVRRLRAEPGLADVRVIFYTATYLESDARQLAESCGVKHILTKPAEPEEVMRVVSSLLDVAPAPVPPTPALDEFRSEHLRLLNMTLAHKAEVVVPRLNAMIELSVQLASEVEPADLLERFCEGVRKILGARYALVSLVRQARPEDRQMFASGLDRETVERLPAVLPARGPFIPLIEERRRFRTVADVESLGLPAILPPARAFLGVPVNSPKTVYGWLCLADRIGGGEFTEEEAQLAATLAGLTGRIYENGTLYAATRRHAEELARSEERFRQLAETIPEVFWVAQADPFEILYVSPAYEVVFGRTTSGLYEDATSWMEAVVPEDLPAAEAFFAKSLRGEQAEAEYRIRRPDGRVRWLWVQAFPVRDEAGRFHRITGLAVDTTDRKSLDQQLRQSQKMEAIGRLAGGVAHDFNNLLGVIMGYSEGALRILPADHAVRPKIDQVLKATERAAGVTRQLLLFSRKQVATPRVIDLGAVVGEMEKMLRTLIGEDVQLAFMRAPGLGRIRADTGEIEQVIMNLVVNARDAMPSGGRITIETANENLDAPLASDLSEIAAGRYVRLVVTDDGPGIPKDIQLYIFEPFFTTKETGKGTGLGLSTVYGIVKQAGGQIVLYSEPGHGASFRIYFPRIDEAVQPADVRSTAIPRGAETILLVEDEDLLRQVTREMLENLGYTVLEASGGEAALRLAEAHDGEIDLLLTDVIMPGISGAETAIRIGNARQTTKILFVSGYTEDAMVRHGVLPSDVVLLQKPFTAGALARKIREVLDGEGGRV
jgi:PAS domain S-box-containing protein